MNETKLVSNFPLLKDRKVLLVSHNFTVTGAPLLLVATGSQMAQSGAQVEIANLGDRDAEFRLPESTGVHEISLDDSFDFARDADLIVANTALAKTWVRGLLDRQPDAAGKTIWWLHEIDMETYGAGMEDLAKVGAAIFDSEYSRQLWLRSGLTPAITVTIQPGISEVFQNEARRLSTRSWAQLARGWWARNQTSERHQIRTQLGVEAEDFLLLSIAQYCALKGQDLLVKAVGRMLAESPDLPLKLLLVGFPDDATRESFCQRLTPAELRATGPNRVINRVVDTKPYYLAADAFVLNTQLPGETFGLVLIEAMAFGLPVLVTSTGGTREIVIDGETGLQHPPGKNGEAKLSENIRLLMTDRKLAKRLGRAGLKRLETHFRADRFYRDYAKMISRVLSQAHRNC